MHRARGMLASFAAARLWPVCVLSSLQASQIGMDEERRRMMMVREKPGRVGNLHVAGPD